MSKQYNQLNNFRPVRSESTQPQGVNDKTSQVPTPHVTDAHVGPITLCQHNQFKQVCVLRRWMSSGHSCETETVAWQRVQRLAKRTFGHVSSPRARQSNYNYYYYYYCRRYCRVVIVYGRHIGLISCPVRRVRTLRRVKVQQ